MKLRFKENKKDKVYFIILENFKNTMRDNKNTHYFVITFEEDQIKYIEAYEK